MESVQWFDIVFGAVFGALSAIFAAGCIEKWGGVTGGVLGTMPTTVVIASIAIAINENSDKDMSDEQFTVPIGMFITILSLSLWRWIPPFLPEIPLSYRITLMIILSVGTWIFNMTIVIFLLEYIFHDYYFIGSIIAFVLTLLAACIASFKPFPSPRGCKSVPFPVHILRGVLSGIAIAVAILLSRSSDVVAGIASVFPTAIIMLTVMVSLSTSQNIELASGAVASMVAGSASMDVYSISFAFLYHRYFQHELDLEIGVMLSAVLSWCIGVITVTVPVWIVLRVRKQQADAVLYEEIKIEGRAETDLETESEWDYWEQIANDHEKMIEKAPRVLGKGTPFYGAVERNSASES